MASAYARKDRPAILVHALGDAIAALKAATAVGTAIAIVSARGAAASGGAGWWRTMAERAQEAVPGADALFVLDCADEAGRALEAIRAGVPAIAVDANDVVRTALAAIAARSDCHLVTLAQAPVLDLAGHPDPYDTCIAWLAGWNQNGAPDVANRDSLG